jgi:prepilin-type N-terminal cleavage/methylation domain-containing protein
MRRGTGGFALLELLIVLGIGSVLAGSAFWQVRSLADRLALRSAAVRLVGDLRDAQARAIAGRDPSRAHGIEFPPDGRSYVTFIQDDAGRRPMREQRLHPRVHIRYARFGGVPGLVMFTGVSLLGAPSGGGTVTLTAGGAVICVRIQPATGRARLDAVGCP